VNGGAIVADVPSNPMIEVPGETPTSPVIRLPVPAAVALEPPTIAKLSAEPSDWAIPRVGTRRSATNPALARTVEPGVLAAVARRTPPSQAEGGHDGGVSGRGVTISLAI